MKKQNSKGDWIKIERVGSGAVVQILAQKKAGYLRKGTSRWKGKGC